METRILVQAVPARSANVAAMLKVVPDAEVVWDKDRQPWDTYVSILERAGDGAYVHMEDDIGFCGDFRRKLEAAISDRPNNVIQFFSRRKDDITKGSRWDSYFSYNCCVYIPPGYARLLYEKSTSERGKWAPTWFDGPLDELLKQRREQHWICVPNLVEHLSFASMVGSFYGHGRSKRRQSFTFGMHNP
jgi:hypothetical protein